MSARPNEVRALADHLTAAGRIRIALPDIWSMWNVAAPRLVGDPLQAPALHEALRALDTTGVINLPVGAWDASTSPPLPRSVTVPGTRAPARQRPWTTYPWLPSMGWVASLPTLSESRYTQLVAINEWLVRTAGISVPIVPMRYRSAELFGDEKQLEAMMKTNLFDAGRLSLTMLACTRIPAPLAAARVGAGPDVLVVENSDPYWVAVEVLRSEPAHPVGLVVWGAGKAFPSQVPTLTVDIAGHGPARGTVWYWGDMDPDGLAIAVEAQRLSTAINGPPLRPAHHLWDAMADHPGQNIGEINWPPSDSGRAWLGDILDTRLQPIRAAHARVAQEAIPADVIAHWVEGLRA
ncbi:MAG: Wadjet anti-phage system protein JetD domain-containing protein [Mycobacterium sp.]